MPVTCLSPTLLQGLVLPPIMLPAGASLPGLPPARQLLLIGLGKQQQQPLGAGSGWGPTSFHVRV